MIVHFICRGNAFRSIIAEAYLKSLKLPGVTVMSSGTVADQHRAGNVENYARTMALLKKHGVAAFAKDHYADRLTPARLSEGDITVCMNRRVYDEALEIGHFPHQPEIWGIDDVGEHGRVWATEAEWANVSEDTFEAIHDRVDRLVKGELNSVL